MAEHSATSGARKIDMAPKQGTPIHSKEGPKPFSGFYWVFTGCGMFVQNLGYPGVTPNSGLCVTVCEVDANGIPFIGNAYMSIGNVAPGNNSLLVYGGVNYDSNVDYRITASIV
jgi:hypothetical protein